MGYFNADRTDKVPSRGLHAPKPGLNSVGEYLVAGRPFVKSILGSTFTANGRIVDNTDTKLASASDELSVEFPFVTSRLKITNNTNYPIAVYFCSLTVADTDTPGNSGVKENHNYFVLPVAAAATPSPTLDLKIKCRKVYVAGYGATQPSTGTVNIAAELTNIEETYDCDVDAITGISG